MPKQRSQIVHPGDESRIAAELLPQFPVRCVYRPQWFYKVHVRRSPGAVFQYTLLAGKRPEAYRPFTMEDVEYVFAYLARASWLPTADLLGAGRAAAVSGTIELLDAAGDLGFSGVTPDFTAGGPRPIPVEESALRALRDVQALRPELFAHVLDGVEGNRHRVPSGRASLAAIIDTLAELRWALLLAQAIRLEEHQSLAQFTAQLNPGHWERLAPYDPRFIRAPRRDIGAARLWFSARMLSEGLTPYKVDRFSGPFRMQASPATPLQFLWVTLAVAAGAILPPGGATNLRTCAYKPCQLTLVVSPQRVRGEARFCGDRCRLAFNAVRATRERRRRSKSFSPEA
jgi:hypothetical protein